MTPMQPNIIDLYQEQELCMEDFYRFLVHKVPQHADIWESMAKDEREHAQWVHFLKSQVASGAVIFDEGKIRINSLQGCISYIKEVKRKMSLTSVTASHAFAVAVDIEKALVERNVFQRFRGDSLQARKILQVLNEQQQAHFHKIQDIAARLAPPPRPVR